MNYSRVFLLLFMLFWLNDSNAQTWNWAKQIGSILSDKATVVKVDTADNVIVVGYFSQPISLGNNVNIAPVGQGKEIFIAKYNNQGVCQWAICGGHHYDDRILGMDVDIAGNIYITGTCWFNITLGAITLNALPQACCDQCFVYKISPTGTVLWGNMAGGQGDDQGLDLVNDNLGNSYIGGFMSGDTIWLGGTGVASNTLAIPATNSGSHVYNYWVGKINAAGQWVWGKTFGNLPWDPSTFKYVERDIAITLDDNDNLFIAGGYDGTRLFGSTTLTSVGGTDVFLQRMTTNGTIDWAISGGSDKDDWANGVAVDSLGNVYVTGEHRDSLIFPLGNVLVKNYNKRDIFVAKFEASDGTCQWGKRAGSDLGSERGNDVYADKNCHVYVTGEVGAKGKFGPFDTDSVGTIHAFVSRISPAGNWLWVTTGGTIDSADIRSNSVILGKNDNLYVCGNFRDDAKFGASNFMSAGKTDGFLASLKDMNKDLCVPVPFVNAGISSLSYPTDTICDSDIYPKFVLTNDGNFPLTTATIQYSIDGGAPIFFNWTGYLDSLDTDLVTLPSTIVSSGAHTITITIISGNGQPDALAANNVITQNFYVISNAGAAFLPYIEGFESGIFPSNGMTLNNPTGGQTWQIANNAAAIGIRSIMISNLLNNVLGAEDDINLPTFDFSPYPNPVLLFDYAYAPYTAGASDTLEILIASCGSNYTSFAKYYGSTLATANPTTAPFVPTSKDWKNRTLDLSAFAGSGIVKIKFRNISGYENNLYLDNINVLGFPLGVDGENEWARKIDLYPNPAHNLLNINYQADENEAINLSILDIAGHQISSFSFDANIGRNEWKVNVENLTTGMYIIQLTNGSMRTAKKVVVNH